MTTCTQHKVNEGRIRKRHVIFMLPSFPHHITTHTHTDVIRVEKQRIVRTLSRRSFVKCFFFLFVFLVLLFPSFIDKMQV